MKRGKASSTSPENCSQNYEPKVKKSKPTNHDNSNGLLFSSTDEVWNIEEELQYEFDVSLDISRNVCRLLDEGNSIPFIARYRREQTGGMEPEVLRQYKESFEGLKTVKEKCNKLMLSVDKLGKLTNTIKKSFLAARTCDELDTTFTPFKTSAKTTLAERARSAGLGDFAENLLLGKICNVDLMSLIDPNSPGRATSSDIEKGIQNVIADYIVYNKEFVTFLRDIQKKAALTMEVKEGKPKGKADKNDKSSKTKVGGNETDPKKFEIYFNFSRPVKHLQSYQVLAINRGESLKFLSVKINVPDWALFQIEKQVRFLWLQKGMMSKFRTDMITAAVKDAYKRLICPQMIRSCRSELTKMAENEAIGNFANNLNKLLLTPPYHGKTILSIDPGFANGCKIAVLSPTGDVLDTDFIYPRFNSKGPPDQKSLYKLQDLVLKHEVSTISIGNGTACRETENLVDFGVKSGAFHPHKVQYVIVDERGASIYSCTEIARKEFPKLDTNLISAVSIGRRLQDPLSEYVKIEPHHLGCGMYQHDVKQAKLKTALDETVTECVSFVGVNINSCSEHLLQRVAGLTATRAKAIIEYRKKNGDYVSRLDVKKVKGIGEKVFEQCAGFIRVLKTDSNAEDGAVFNPLDATNIHPESYVAANQFMKTAGLNIKEIGTERFKNSLRAFINNKRIENIANQLKIGVPTLNLIVESLEKGLGYDLRVTNDGPIFKSGMTRLEDVGVGSELTGRVTNVTAFGAFIDIGLGKNGLLHNSKMRGKQVELGHRVKVKLINKDPDRGKIGLELIQVL